MEERSLPRILCVDDEPNVLDGLVRHLRRTFSVVTAVGPRAGLAALAEQGPFQAVVSDLRMPEMDGVAFLGRVREAAADTVRVLLTGNADLESSIAAVNEGNIFRFLTKPCPPELLIKALSDAVEQHRLITAERVLLEQTLQGCVKTLTDILALTNPAAFGRATRLKQYVSGLGATQHRDQRWALEVAAMLSQIGCVILPPETAEKLYDGRELTAPERAMVERLPAVTEELLANVPRLELVRAILRFQHKRYDGTGPPANPAKGPEIPWGARALKVVVDFDALESKGMPAALALDALRQRHGSYDPAILETLGALLVHTRSDVVVREVSLAELERGMLFAEEVRARSGVLLIARGQEVTENLLERIRNFARTQGLKEPMRVITRVERQHGSVLPPPPA
jgi:response regulator RpfG family c-di-GMP phosphodiesterase